MPPPFTNGELEVMQVLWAHESLKPEEIQEHFSRPIKNAALRFQLKTLLEKEHVGRVKRGKAYYYHAITTRDSGLRRMVKRMSDVFSQGSIKGLIAELVAAENLSPDDLEELKRFAQQKDTTASKRKRGTKR